MTKDLIIACVEKINRSDSLASIWVPVTRCFDSLGFTDLESWRKLLENPCVSMAKLFLDHFHHYAFLWHSPRKENVRRVVKCILREEPASCYVHTSAGAGMRSIHTGITIRNTEQIDRGRM